MYEFIISRKNSKVNGMQKSLENDKYIKVTKKRNTRYINYTCENLADIPNQSRVIVSQDFLQRYNLDNILNNQSKVIFIDVGEEIKSMVVVNNPLFLTSDIFKSVISGKIGSF